jgi:DNA polymerase-3 subunit alpha
VKIIREFSDLPGGGAALLVEDDDLRFLVLSHNTSLSESLWGQARLEGAEGVLEGWPQVPFRYLSAADAPNGRWYTVHTKLTFLQILVEVQRLHSTPVTTGNFVHLHTHSEFSALDGLSTIPELVNLAVADNNAALGITDHGTCAGHPALQRSCDDAGIKPIFGMEAYFIDNRLERPSPGDTEAAKRLRNYNHLILLAKDDEGLRNLWALSTEGFRDGFYYKPRIDWDSLRRHSKGLIATTACLGGPISRLLLDGHQDQARARVGRLLDLFGEDLYVEIQPSDLEEQIRLNPLLISLAHDLGIQVVAAADGHFPTADDHDLHKTWLRCQTSKDNEDYWHFDHSMTESEIRDRLSYLDPQVVDQAVENTAKLAEKCTARIESKVVMPVYYRQGGYERDAEKLRQMCLDNWTRIKPGRRYDDQVYRDRFEREFKLLEVKKYCGYFLMVADYVGWAKDNGILVGPGRGSGAGSLIAFLMRITEVDPVQHEILFERFITDGRMTLPDFDVDFPASKRSDIQNYLRSKWGDDHTLRIGTHLRYKNKGIIQKLFSALGDELPPEAFADAKKLSAIIEDAESGTAGLGLSWEALWAQEEELLEPYRRKYPKLFAIAERLVGRLNSYGRHAAGIVISTDHALTDRLPLRGGEDGDQMISQFDMDALDSMGYVKFDILTIRTLDTVQAIVDGARQYFGVEVDVYDFDTEYDDPMVWDEISDGNTLGMFQIETTSGTKLVRRLKPTNLGELSDVGALVRPGPTRSGLTEAYLRRREGTEPVNFADPRMEEFLAPTQGVMIYQEQVMQAAMVLAGYDSTEADGVRKILGKKKVDQVIQAGHRFVDGCVAGGMDKDVAAHLWEQMAEFAKYGFGKAHSISYAMITYWTAWWKVHYVVPTLTALLSTVDKERVPEFVKEARRLEVPILSPDINASGRGFRPQETSIRYGLDSIKGIGPKAIEELEAGQPYASFTDFQERATRAVNAGVQLLLARVGAFDSLEPNRKGLVTKLMAEKEGVTATCIFKTTLTTDPEGLACTYDWANEPRPINKRTLKLLKPKPLPKKCTKGCRQYKPQGLDGIDLSGSYTDKEIREIEQELLGIQLSSTPFDMLPPADREEVRKYAELLDKGVAGVYMVVGTIIRVRKHRDRSDRDMAFFNLSTETTDLDVVVFGDQYVIYGVHLKPGNFVVAEVRRTDRGSQLKTLHVLDA